MVKEWSMRYRATLILLAWVPCRLLFLALWSFAHPIGVAQAWLAARYREAVAS